MAQTGRRMKPTFPSSSLESRTSGFPNPTPRPACGSDTGHFRGAFGRDRYVRMRPRLMELTAPASFHDRNPTPRILGGGDGTDITAILRCERAQEESPYVCAAHLLLSRGQRAFQTPQFHSVTGESKRIASATPTLPKRSELTSRSQFLLEGNHGRFEEIHQRIRRDWRG